MKVIKNDKQLQRSFLKELRERDENKNANAQAAVEQIIQRVKSLGDEALLEYTKAFDKVELESLEVDKNKIAEALDKISPELLQAMKDSAKNIREFHEKQLTQSFVIADEGRVTGQRVRALSRVGIYVPGGTAAYPSSVLMNAIPAKVAGVKEIIMVTPPDKNGSVRNDILAAAAIAGVDRIFCVGGAQAVAALAYGTQTIPRVDKITGPGNIFVATAKRLVYGIVDIDMIAGPSEILVIADSSAKPEFLAADLLSQAEHDPMAASILLTDSEEIAFETQKEIEKQLEKLERKDIAKKSIEDFGAILVCDNIDTCCEISDEIAPEHLEIMTQNPFDYLGKINNAGSVFLGQYSPEPLGDYFAGANHVLPTSGTARFFSPLSTNDFMKKSAYIYYSKDALEKVADKIEIFAQSEGLTAHKNSITIRKGK